MFNHCDFSLPKMRSAFPQIFSSLAVMKSPWYSLTILIRDSIGLATSVSFLYSLKLLKIFSAFLGSPKTDCKASIRRASASSSLIVFADPVFNPTSSGKLLTSFAKKLSSVPIVILLDACRVCFNNSRKCF